MYKALKYVALFMVPLLILSGCKKNNIEAGIKTTVTGVVFDYNKQLPIANAPIYIIEYESYFWGLLPKAKIDSTVSGADGKYSITFTTTGQGIDYRVRFEPNAKYYFLDAAVHVNVGKDTTVNFSALELHTLKARIQVVDNPNPPLQVSTIGGFGGRIYGQNNDTTIFLKIIPNMDNGVQFAIINKDTPTIYNYMADTFNFPGFTDTFSRTIQVHPKTFPKRG